MFGKIFISLCLLLMISACQQNSAAISPPATTPVKSTCMGEVKKDRMCTMQYDPVCGCNGKTYANACVAKAAGVLQMEKGACSNDLEDNQEAERQKQL